jgi:hypothetical protein
MVANLRTAFASKFAAIEHFAIAAQPKTGSARRGEGVQNLLTYWTAEPARYRPPATAVDVPRADRYFARLQKPHTGAAR